MSKSAAARKMTVAKKAPSKNQMKAKPALKMVKSNAKPIKSKAQPAKKIVLKEVKKVNPSAKKQPAKSTSSVSKKTTNKMVAKPVAQKASAKPVAKETTKFIAKPLAVVAPKPMAAKPAQFTQPTGNMVARPISVNTGANNGFNKMPRPNGFVKKSYRTVDPKAPHAEFKIGSYVVYPTHGVGQIIEEETQEIGGVELKMFVISFAKDKMTLRVPKHRAHAAGLRHISSNNEMKKMFDTLKAKAKTSRGMWSRRAQEYESKINSGDVLLIAEVVRDLHQNVDMAERSYSERMIYESAFNRLAGELAASEKTEFKNAGDKLLKLLRAKKAA